MKFSLSTLLMLSELLDAQPIPSNHPRLVELARQVATARAELAEAVTEAEGLGMPVPGEGGAG